MKRFFRVIWKINALLICLAGLLLTVMLTFALFSMLQSMLWDRHGAAIAVRSKSETPTPKEIAKLSIEKVESLDGTTIVRCTVQSGDSGSSKMDSLSRYSPLATCNYIFFDTTTNQQTQLFPTNTNVIVESNDFYFPSTPCDKRVTKWTSYIVADKDTDNDGVISASDLKSLAITHADGKDFHVYLTDLDRVLKTELIGENDFYVFYEQNHTVSVSRIDLSNQKIIQTQKIF